MKNELSRDEAAWEAVLAAAWKESAGADGAAWAEEATMTARRVDAALRAEREARRAWWRRARRAAIAAAACAAVLAGAVLWRGSTGTSGPEVASADEEEETTLAEAREAPVAEAFGELEEVLTELAALDFRYDWDDEDLEVAD